MEGLLRDMYEQLAGVRVEAEPARGSALDVVLERLASMRSLASTGTSLCTCTLYAWPPPPR